LTVNIKAEIVIKNATMYLLKIKGMHISSVCTNIPLLANANKASRAEEEIMICSLKDF
jgi:hypothetical protein